MTNDQENDKEYCKVIVFLNTILYEEGKTAFKVSLTLLYCELRSLWGTVAPITSLLKCDSV